MGDQNVDDNEAHVHKVEHSTRTRTMTEKGICYEQDNLAKRSKKLITQIYKFSETINKAAMSEDNAKITETIFLLNEAHSEFEHVVSKSVSFSKPIPDDDVQAVLLAVTTAKMNALKLNPLSQATRTGKAKSLPSKDYNTRSTTDRNATKKNATETSPDIDTNATIVQASNDDRKSTKPKGNIFSECPSDAGKTFQILDKKLQQQLDLLDCITDSNDANLVKTELSNLDIILAELSDANSQLMDTFTSQEKAFHSEWMEQIDTDIFDKKRNICAWLTNNPCSSTKSTRSTRSHSKASEQSRRNKTSTRSTSRSSVTSVLSRNAATERQPAIDVSKINDDTDIPEEVRRVRKKVQLQLNLIDSALDTEDVALVKAEASNLDRILADFADTRSSLKDILSGDQQAQWIEPINSEILKKKQEIYEWLANQRNDHTSSQSHRSYKQSSKSRSHSGISKRTSYSGSSTKSDPKQNVTTRRSQDGALIPKQSTPETIKSQITESDLIEATKTTVQRSYKRLQLQLNLLDCALATDDVELVRTETANLDRILAELTDANSALIDVVNDVEKASQSVWIEQIDTEVFKKKQDICTWLVNHNDCISSRHSSQSNSKSSGLSRKSRRSTSSGASMKSVVEQKAITAGLQAEADMLKLTMTKVMEAEAKRKEEEIKSKIAKINIQIARSQAMEEVYDGSVLSTQHQKVKQACKAYNTNDKVDTTHTGPRVNTKESQIYSRHDTANLTVSEPTNYANKVSCDTSNSKHITELSKDMVRALKAPSAEIDVFSGDPLEYEYFRSNFREAVEKMIDDQRGRLTRLIKYTSGDAKDLIKHCVHGDPLHCYDQAIELLDAEYGCSHRISYAYLKQLQEWPAIKVTDTSSFKKLYRFLLQCRTYKANGRLQELDSASTLKIIIQKLHLSYQDEWSIKAERCRRNGKEANFNDLVNFVDFHSSRSADPAYSRSAMSGEKEKNPVKGFSSKLTLPTDDCKAEKCHLCKKDHHLEECKSYLSKDLKERNKTVYDLKLCFKCLNPTSERHYARVCTKRMTCSICSKLHPSTLHDASKENKATVTNNEQERKKISACSVQHKDTEDVISLCILPVFVSHMDNPDHEILVYAMLDNDCTGCFGTTEIMDQLAPSQQRDAYVTVETINGTTEKQTTALDGLLVRCSSKHADSYSTSIVKMPTTFGFDGLIVTRDEIPTPTNLKHWDHLKKPCDQILEYDQAIPFGLMIGGNCPKALEPLEVIPSQDGGPYAYRTSLGWCVVGPMASSRSDTTSIQCHRTRVSEKSPTWTAIDATTGISALHHFVEKSHVKDRAIDKKLEDMYNLEFNEIDSENKGPSKEDEKFMEIMASNVKKVNGHYQLPLPFKSDDVNLPDNRKQAEKRLHSVRRKMEKSTTYREEYVKTIETLLEKGYARKCNDETKTQQGNLWYLPHHGVYQPVKKKLRIVFDCSASYQGHSLNDHLLQGPDLTNQLVGVLLRFRMYNVPVMADIEAMFHQVRVPEDQHSFLRFLWWKDGDTKLVPDEFEMCVHIFGAISSPSCANYALKTTAEDNRETFGNDAADTLLRDFYVDDMLKSTDEEEEAASLLQRVQQSCEQGGFNLTKVVSNSLGVINSTAINKRAASLQEFELLKKLPIERALGVVWSVENDSFGFRINVEDQPLTRRGILSSISSIYDPCGLASPFLLKGRKILQEITADKNGWDDAVSPDHIKSWEKWRAELPLLEKISVKRCLKTENFGQTADYSLHCFSDAAFFGYGQASYLRQVNTEGKICVSLIMAKSRVSPLKPTTVPRLELTAAVLSSNIGALVKSELAIQSLRDTYWIDNMVALGYIYNDSRRFRIFVANRTRKIRERTEKSQWRYISTEHNPGDDASRGLSFGDEEKVNRWFNGPEFLHQPESEWPAKTDIDDIARNDPEVKVKISANVAVSTNTASCLLSTIELQISDWHKQKRVVATMKKFANLCRKLSVTKELTTTDIQEAETILIRLMQEKYLKEELHRIRKGIRAKSSALEQLQPTFDDDSILRVGGRISNSNLDDRTKHPIILAKQGSERIIEWHHRNIQHQGRTSTVNELRSNGYWFLSVNSQVRKVLRNCMRCRLFRGRLAEQMMANLPTNRLSMEPPFTYCGVDIFGPFYIKEGRKQMKRYGVLFTCFSLRAVHIETAVNIDTDSFIQALRRFIARRGPVRSIRSDNGGNFIGCENEFVKEIEKMDKDKISSFLLSNNCDWIIWERNPPVSSHMGGVWERMIRSVRTVLDSLLKEHPSRLDDESLRTLLTEAENIVNSRPMTTENLSDPEACPITPNQLLTLKTKVVMPPPGVFQKEHIYCRRRWKAVQYLANEFWRRWQKEYLLILQGRQKWMEKTRNFEVGDIVLIKEENLSRNQWKLGKVTETFPSKDGLIRTVNVRLSPCKTSLQRPITKLVLLIGVEEQQ